jgi:membrane protein YqaA with SNARE-associated domain
MLRKLYDWVMDLAGSRHAPSALCAVSFAESSFFPIPPDVMLAPMVLARPERAYLYAGLCTVSSVLGGCLGYFIGFHLGDLGHWLLALLGHADGEAAFREWFGKWGLWVILIKGLTPIPYKLVTIASGLAHFSFVTFLWASVVTRGARFFLTATLLKYFGPAVREEVEKRLTLYTVIGVAVLVGAFVAVRALG